MRQLARWTIQACCLPGVPFMAAWAWIAEDGMSTRQAVDFAWNWWLGFWEVLP